MARIDRPPSWGPNSYTVPGRPRRILIGNRDLTEIGAPHGRHWAHLATPPPPRSARSALATCTAPRRKPRVYAPRFARSQSAESVRRARRCAAPMAMHIIA